MDYATLSPDELVSALGQAGRTPDKALLDACLTRQEALTPFLLDALDVDTERAEEEDWADDDPRWYLAIHAGRLLIAFREPKALSLFAAILRSEEREVLLEWFDTHDLAHYGPDALATFERVAQDERVWQWGRSHAIGVVEQIGQRHPESREHVVRFLRGLLPAVNADGRLRTPLRFDEDRAALFTSVAGSLADLKDHESRHQIHALYQIGMIEEAWLGDEDAYLRSLDEEPFPQPEFDLIQSYYPVPWSETEQLAAMEQQGAALEAPYRAASDEDLVGQLDNAGYAPHPQLIAALLRREDTVRPALRVLLERPVSRAWRYDDPRWYSYLHAAVLLTTMRDELALPVIERLLREDDEGMLHDWLREALPAHYGPGALPMLERLVQDDTLTPENRHDLLYQIALVAAYHPDARSRVLELLHGELPDATSAAASETQSMYWTNVLYMLLLLDDEEAETLVETLYDTVHDSKEERVYREILDQVRHDSLNPLPQDLMLQYGMRRMHHLQEQQQRERQQRNQLQFLGGDGEGRATFTRNEEKVGRNAPCPCGSGKKYKKCCGRS